MRVDKKVIMNRAACLMLIALVMSGCSTVESGRVIKAGDKVGVNFTCRLSNGDLAVTTDKAIAEDSSNIKSPVYFPLKDFGPLDLKAGVAPEGDPVKWGFMDELQACLAGATSGVSIGEKKTLECKPELIAGRVGDERFLRMAKVRTRPKEIRVSRDEYVARTGHEPEAGQLIDVDRDFTGRVAELHEKEVVIAVQIPESGKVRTPFGVGSVKDAGDRFEIDIQANVGDLVRTGPLAGKVAKVDDRFITVDFGYSFAGERLKCEVTTVETGTGSEEKKKHIDSDK